MIDLHSHILAGVDDGAATMREARTLARAAAAEGIHAIAATPHVRADYPTTAERMERGVAELRRDLADEGIPIEILHGGEIEVSFMWEIPPDELVRFTLAQSGRYLLLEFPYVGWPRSLDLAISTLRGRGLSPLLAHPERNPEVQDRPDRLSAAVASGAFVQVTAASLDGRIGAAARRAAEQLVALRLVHVIASDAHGPQVREAGMATAASALGDPGLARYLTEDAPAAIVAGDPLPPMP
ncbi:MAG: CpsB/CapC family capsule biosynthesis tyrosine phosphatase [Gaiellaceae bacterium]